MPEQAEIPQWLKVENICFSRLDGGYIEIQKAKRTKWGQGWQDEEYNVLENIYLKYSDEIISKLKQGGINLIWVTWSNGWSLEYEAPQRDNLVAFIDKCHKNEIKVIAYICSTNIFWENMFLDYPVSFDIARKQPSGIPYTYHGENPLRFVANMDHPDWLSLQKKRVKLALDAGIDGFFFDNPLSGDQPIENQVYFFNEIQKFIKLENDRPDVPVASNFGMQPRYQDLNDQMDFTFNEFGRQPGVNDSIWINGNIKKIKYIKSFLAPWKTAIHEANYFPGGLRERAFMPPKAQKLARAEAASFGAVYVNFIEGRLLTTLIHNNKEALESWKAVGLYNRFLKTHAKYYSNALQPDKILVLIPEDTKFSFDDMDQNIGWLLDYLARNNVLYNVELAGHLHPEDLKEARLLILPDFLNVKRQTVTMIETFKSSDGKVIGIGGTKFIEEISDHYYPWQFISQNMENSVNNSNFLKTILTLSEGCSLDIKNAPYTLGNITIQKETGRIVIHLINYSDHPDENIVVRADLKPFIRDLSKSTIKAFSPDTQKDIISDLQIRGSLLEFHIPKLDTYTIVTVN